MKKLLLVLLLTMGIFSTSSFAETNGQEVENFVKRFYVEVLERTADPVGLNDWTNRLTTGVSAGSDVATGFVFSAEFEARGTTDTEFLNILYKAFFNRTADAGGLSGWLEELSDGTSREDVLNGFLYSTEFDNLARSYGIKTIPGDGSKASGGTVEDFVKRFYSEVLGRIADASGLADWVNRLNTNVSTGADIALGFIFSAEFTNRNTDNVTFINILYKAFFNRSADEGGFNGWLSQLERGVSREDVLNGFLRSDEFINLCNGYGITAYEGAPKFRPTFSMTPAEGAEKLGAEFHTYTYDANGNVLTDLHRWTEQIITGGYATFTTRNESYTYTYDSNNNMLTEVSSSGEKTYTYDDNNNVHTYRNVYTDDDGVEHIDSSTYTYHINNEILTWISISSDHPAFLVTYTYDDSGKPITFALDDTVYHYEYDVNGNVLSKPEFKEHEDYVATYTYTYDANGNRLTSTKTNEDGTEDTVSYTYDANHNLITALYSHNDGASVYEYTYDAKGNRIMVTEDDYFWLYAYDTRGEVLVYTFLELDRVIGSPTYTSYTYDVHNNLLTKTENGIEVENHTWIMIP